MQQPSIRASGKRGNGPQIAEGPLRQADVVALTAPGRHRFGPGLYLQVSGPDAKSWIYRFTVRRKERFMGLAPRAT